MKVFFEIHTTSCKPIMCILDNDDSMFDVIHTILHTIENYTMIQRESVCDLFAQHSISKEILSIAPNNTQITLQHYMNENKEFFKSTSMGRMASIYKLYVIDDVYLQRKSENKPTPVYDEEQLHNPSSTIFVEVLKRTIDAFYIKL